MSASIPRGSDPSPAGAPAALPRTSLSRRPRRRALPAWWALSAALHGLLFASLLLFTAPGMELLDLARGRSAIPEVNSDRLEEISEHLGELNKLDLQARLAELQEVREALGEIRDEAFREFSEFAAAQAAGAADAVALAQKEALEAQQQASRDLEEAGRAQDRASEAARRAAERRDPEAPQQAREAQQQSREAQGRAKQGQTAAEDAMEKAARAMGWIGAREPEEAQRKALEGQAGASTARAAAEQAQERARQAQEEAARARQRLSEEEERLRAAAQKRAEEEALRPPAQQKAGEKAAAAEEARAQAAERREQLRSATDQAALARAEASRQPSKSEERRQAEARAKEAEDRRRAAEAEARKAAEEEKRAERERNEAAQQLRRAEEQAARARAEEERRQKARDDRAKELQQRLDEAAERQEQSRRAEAEAQEAQKRARAAHEEAIRAMARWLRDAGRPEPPPLPPAPAAAPLAWEEMKTLDAYEIYRRAVEAEKSVAETYKEIRAAELGMLRKMPLEEALRNTDVARPVRPDMDREALTKAARTAEGLERHKAAMKEALAEADKMVELARSMHDAAQSLARSGKEGLSVLVAHAGAMEKAAAEDPNRKAVDLTALMRPGAGAGESAARPGTSGSGGRSDRSPTHPRLENDTPAVRPGRMIAADGQPANWMYIDSWYVIGPWPNPGRVNIDKKYPPETVVDLDAAYPGADGKLLRWTYQKSPRPNVVPREDREYSIYYAYTEIYSDEPRDVWAAIGSDDKSKIWVNGHVIWESVPWHKPWNINEGFRKIHLQKGRNRILYRLENGWMSCAFSLILCTHEGP